MADPGGPSARARSSASRSTSCTTRSGPLYGAAGHEDDERPAEQQFATRALRAAHARDGHARDRGRALAIDGYGLRDHSWGPRYWQAIHAYEWLTLNFGPDLGAMVSVIQRDADGKNVRRGGVLVRGDELEPMVDARDRGRLRGRTASTTAGARRASRRRRARSSRSTAR